jgi:hypothetical protein
MVRCICIRRDALARLVTRAVACGLKKKLGWDSWSGAVRVLLTVSARL